MKLKQLKTIDIKAKEWSDKINGNSYFSSDVTLNYGMDSQEVIKLPFQYGYGDQYYYCLLYTSPSPRDGLLSRMPSSA